MTTSNVQQMPAVDWMAATQAYLDGELARLRLLLRRRVLWLRRHWQQDPLPNTQGMLISEAEADWQLRGEDRRAESRFYQEEPEALQIGRTLAELADWLAEQRKSQADAGMPLPLDVLAHLFDLTSFERKVLLLCLAPALDPGFERLYAYVQDEVARKYATPHLALTLFGNLDGEGGERDSFLPEAPLRRFRLLSLDPGPLPGATWAARPLLLDERMADYLRGVNRLDDSVAELLRPLPPAPLAPAHQALVDRLVHALEANGDRRPWSLLNLTSSPQAGKRAVARALGERLGLQLFSLDVRRLPAPGPERPAMLRLLEREAVLLPFALYLDTSTLDVSDAATAAAVEEVVERLGVFLVVGSQERWQSERRALAVAVPKPDRGAQSYLWRQALAGAAASLDGAAEALAQQFDFGPQAIVEAVAAAENRAWLRSGKGNGAPTTDDLWQACRGQAGWRLDELAQRIQPCYTWKEIILPEDVYQQLQEIATQVALRHQVYEAWGFGVKLSRGRGISALFAGPSGTGKTMAAEILANHLQLDLYRIDLAGVVSKYIGETEKNLKKVFDAAEQSGAILFFDEADALFGKRTEVKDSHDRYANIEVNYLLQRMEDYRGLAILATNRKSALDRAFLRRLRFLVDFPFPDAASRCRIWQGVFPPAARVDGLDYAALARLDISGGNIKNIALNAAFLAAAADRPIGMAQVMHAARREYAKIDKLPSEAEFGPYWKKGAS